MYGDTNNEWCLIKRKHVFNDIGFSATWTVVREDVCTSYIRTVGNVRTGKYQHPESWVLSPECWVVRKWDRTLLAGNSSTFSDHLFPPFHNNLAGPFFLAARQEFFLRDFVISYSWLLTGAIIQPPYPASLASIPHKPANLTLFKIAQFRVQANSIFRL